MLDNLLKKIKSSLPEKVRTKLFKDDIDDEEEDESEEEDTVSHEINDDTGELTIKPGKKAKNDDEDDKDEDDEDDEDEEEDSEEALKKKKKQKIIRIALVLIVGFVAMELFLVDPETPVEVVDEAPPAKRPGGIKGIVEGEEPAKPAGITGIQEEPAKPAGITGIQEEPAKPAGITGIQEEPAKPAGITGIQEEPMETQVVEEVEAPEVSEPMPQETVEVPQAEEEVLEQAPMIRERPTQVGVREETTNLEFEQVTESPKTEPTPPSMLGAITEKIESKLEQVDPPDYLNTGRGLVYNCTGRHWACVERESYFQCRDHMLWSKQEEKSPGCVVRDVYATIEDCRVVQIHYINTNEPTDFCE